MRTSLARSVSLCHCFHLIRVSFQLSRSDIAGKMALPLSIFGLSPSAFLEDAVMETVNEAIACYKRHDYAQCQAKCREAISRKTGKVSLVCHLTLLAVFCASSADYGTVEVREVFL
jgi:hypothetical protein